MAQPRETRGHAPFPANVPPMKARAAPGAMDAAPRGSQPKRQQPGYSLALLSRMAASSFLMSSGDSSGRSTLIVSLLSLAVRVKGGL